MVSLISYGLLVNRKLVWVKLYVSPFSRSYILYWMFPVFGCYHTWKQYITVQIPGRFDEQLMAKVLVCRSFIEFALNVVVVWQAAYTVVDHYVLTDGDSHCMCLFNVGKGLKKLLSRRLSVWLYSFLDSV